MVGDGDDVDVVEAVESAFAIEISNEEAEGSETFGQLFDVVSAKFGHSHIVHPKCPGAVAFYKLRSGLRKSGYEGPITPSSDLSGFFRSVGARKVRRALANETGLELPGLALSTLSIVVLGGILTVGGVAAFMCNSWLLAFSTTCLLLALAFMLPTVLPKKQAQMGAFTQDCVAWNYGHLARLCGGVRSRDIWEALVIVVRESSGTGYTGVIDRETRFFR